MKGIFIPDITVEMFRNGCLEAIEALMADGEIYDIEYDLTFTQPEIAEKLYLCKCYITDKDGLQHEVIHTGDIRRVTGWEI